LVLANLEDEAHTRPSEGFKTRMDHSFRKFVFQFAYDFDKQELQQRLRDKHNARFADP
jgi:hydroxypyruvate isomerase